MTTSNWRLAALLMVSTFVLGSSFAPLSTQNSISRHTENPKHVKRHQPTTLAGMLLDQENDLKDMTSTLLPSAKSVTSFLLPAFMTFAIAFPAMAADFDSKIFSGNYDDPLHPQCRRQIQVNAAGTTFHFSGDSVGPLNDSVIRGCSPKEIKEYGGRQKLSLDGTISGNIIKADDSSLQGVWEPAGSAPTEFGDVDGIRWNDGNKWIVKEKTAVVKAGEFITFSYIGVSLLAGVNGLRQMTQRRKFESSN